MKKIFINGKNISFKTTNTGEVIFGINLLNQESLTIIDGDKKISEKHIGVDNVNLQDAAGCYAYHIPEGIILHYNPKKEINQLYNKDWKNISVLDFALRC